MFYAWMAAFDGFIGTYLLQCGLSTTRLSLVFACNMLTSFIGAFFWGKVGDKFRTNRRIFLFCFTALLLVCSLIYLMASRNLTLAVTIFPLKGFFLSSLSANLDAWVLRTFKEAPEQYGRIRGTGSVGYALMALLAGRLIARFGYGMIEFLHLSVGITALIIVEVTAEVRIEQGTQIRKGKGGLKELLGNKTYVILMVILLTCGLSISPYINMKTVFISAVNGSVFMLGLDSFIGVMFQAFLLFVSGRFLRIPVKIRLLLMTVILFIQLLIIFIAVNPWMMIAATMCWEVSYVLMLISQREIVETSVKPEMRTLAHSLTDAVYINFAGVIALVYSGYVIDHYGIKAIAIIGIALLILPIAITVILLRKGSEFSESY